MSDLDRSDPGLVDPETAAGLNGAFARHVAESVAGPLRTALDRYVATLQEAVAGMAALAPDRVDGPPEDEAELEEARDLAERRHRYADRFGGHFGTGLFRPAAEARAAFFAALGEVAGPRPAASESVELLREADAPEAPDLVRPGPAGRLFAALRRPATRVVPLARLEAVYLRELQWRLEPVAGAAARLTSVAVAEIRQQLHEHTELEHEDAGPGPRLGAAADDVATRLDAVVESVLAEYGRALRATTVRVPDPRVGEQSATRREHLLEGWSEFEETLMANVASEVVLARALGAMEAAVAETARELEAICEHRGVEPLERLAAGLAELGARADALLESEGPDGLGEMAAEAGRLFAAELPRVRALLSRTEEQTERLEKVLAEIPESVPEDLQISDHPVQTIPERPRKLGLREAPVKQLLNTACGGSLPRWLDRSLATAREEIGAMIEELQRARNAFEFQLRAPERGGFARAEVRGLVAGITERTVAQLEDLRAQGLTPLETLVVGLEERASEEADALRSALANREFMRIHSEIAEEQAVRQLATGVDWARSGLAAVGRGLGSAWAAVRSGVTAVRAWAQRQLGVDEVARDVMLESLEQSLIGADQKVVALPTIYRQLFDVEADVPWAELLVNRDEELDVIRRGFERWVDDLSASVAIVGEKGSGKTTLIRLAEQQIFSDSRVVRAEPDRSLDDPEEVLARLGSAFGVEGGPELADRINQQEPAVAIVEDLHHYFIRALGGFDAMEAFLELISATRDNVLWVVTMDEFAWRYLTRTLGLEAHFVHKVSTTNLSPEKLERAIMARHEVSGFALRFEMDEPEPQDSLWARLLGRTAKGELTRKEAQRRRYFIELSNIAEGNIVLALFYWMRSIREMDEHVLVLGDPEIIELEFLERLPLAQLHTIAAIILHGGLSERAHRRVFQLPATESRLLLASIADAHIVFLSSDGEYKINKVLYRPFIRLLVSRNVF